MKKFSDTIVKSELKFNIDKELELNIYVDIDSFNLCPKLKCVKKYEDEGFELHLGNYDEFYNFGVWYYDKEKRSGSGYWSSNTEFVREELDIHLIEITIIPKEGYKLVGYITVDYAKGLIPKDYCIKLNKYGFYHIFKEE